MPGPGRRRRFSGGAAGISTGRRRAGARARRGAGARGRDGRPAWRSPVATSPPRGRGSSGLIAARRSPRRPGSSVTRAPPPATTRAREAYDRVIRDGRAFLRPSHRWRSRPRAASRRMRSGSPRPSAPSAATSTPRMPTPGRLRSGRIAEADRAAREATRLGTPDLRLLWHARERSASRAAPGGKGWRWCAARCASTPSSTSPARPEGARSSPARHAAAGGGAEAAVKARLLAAALTALPILALAHQAGLSYGSFALEEDRLDLVLRSPRRSSPLPGQTPLPTTCATASRGSRPRAAGDGRRDAGRECLCLDAGRRQPRAAGRRAALGQVPLSTRGRARGGPAQVRVADAAGARPPREGARGRQRGGDGRRLRGTRPSASRRGAPRGRRRPGSSASESSTSSPAGTTWSSCSACCSRGAAPRRRPGGDQLHGRSRQHLALATFGVVTPPAGLIEPPIAASVIPLGLENLLDLRRGVARTPPPGSSRSPSASSTASGSPAAELERHERGWRPRSSPSTSEELARPPSWRSRSRCSPGSGGARPSTPPASRSARRWSAAQGRVARRAHPLVIRAVWLPGRRR